MEITNFYYLRKFGWYLGRKQRTSTQPCNLSTLCFLSHMIQLIKGTSICSIGSSSSGIGSKRERKRLFVCSSIFHKKLILLEPNTKIGILDATTLNFHHNSENQPEKLTENGKTGMKPTKQALFELHGGGGSRRWQGRQKTSQRW